MNGLCRFCSGYGNCAVIQSGKYEWRKCPFCEGHGTRNEYKGAPLIRSHAK